MKIVALGASNSRNSINQKLAVHACDVLVAEFSPDAEIEILDLNKFEMPIYSIDRQAESGIPEQAHRFFDAMTSADAIIISFAEHNGSYAVAYKNVYDWASRIDMKVFQDKPILLMSASVGSHGGANVLKSAVSSIPHFGGDVKASFSVGPFAEFFDEAAAQLVDAGLSQTLRKALGELLIDQ